MKKIQEKFQKVLPFNMTWSFMSLFYIIRFKLNNLLKKMYGTYILFQSTSHIFMQYFKKKKLDSRTHFH